MKFEIDYIEKLAKIIADNELTEISLEDGEQAITIRKDVVTGTPVVAAAPAPVAVAPVAQAVTPATPALTATIEAAPIANLVTVFIILSISNC